jgi:hypothetical protein
MRWKKVGEYGMNREIRVDRKIRRKLTEMVPMDGTVVL